MGIELVTSGKVPGYFCPLKQFNVVLRTNARHCARKSHIESVKCMHNIVTTRHALAHSNSQNSGCNRRPHPNPP